MILIIPLVEALFHADKEIVLACEMPQYVILQVSEVEPGAKGDTATNTLTPCTVETGAEVRVPLFIQIGEVVKVDTRTGEYVGRVK